MRQRFWIVIGCILFVAAFLIAQPAQRPGSPDRYKLISAQVLEPVEGGDSISAGTVFLLDSESGQVWRYQPSIAFKSPDGTEKRWSDLFRPVSVAPPAQALPDHK
jgi:hypothetical protein